MLGQRLQRIRESLNLSRYEVEQATKIRKLNLLEQGDRHLTVAQFVKLCRLYKLSDSTIINLITYDT